MAAHKDIQSFIKNTNFAALRKQKRILVKITSGKPLTQKETAEIEGILSFYDAFQDMCEESYGVSSKKIFGKLA